MAAVRRGVENHIVRPPLDAAFKYRFKRLVGRVFGVERRSSQNTIKRCGEPRVSAIRAGRLSMSSRWISISLRSPLVLFCVAFTPKGERRVPGRGVRHPDPVDRDPGGRPCPAATSRRWSWPASCRDRCGADRQPADPRRRRRLHRVHPPAARRRARPRHRGDDRLHRARRGGRARRPDRGDVPRQDRRHRSARTPRARCSD